MEQIKKETEEDPLKIYDNVLFLSCENYKKGKKQKQDFFIGGDTAHIITHIITMMHKHPEFAQMLLVATGQFFKTEIIKS